MTARQEITVLALALIAAVVALLGIVAGEAREVDRWQTRFVQERSVLVRVESVRVESLCRADAQGGGLCAPGTCQQPTTSTTTTAGGK